MNSKAACSTNNLIRTQTVCSSTESTTVLLRQKAVIGPSRTLMGKARSSTQKAPSWTLQCRLPWARVLRSRTTQLWLKSTLTSLVSQRAVELLPAAMSLTPTIKCSIQASIPKCSRNSVSPNPQPTPARS